jgi:PTH1 family peptidyl-tRNA hydrolase
MSIAVIAGLGNPGSQYRNTRHNIGFELVTKLASKYDVVWKTEARFEARLALVKSLEQPLLLIQPTTFMNASGRSLGAILRYYKLLPESMLVIYDDITLDLGRTKLSQQGSAGGHNGVASILENIGGGFLRYRVGVGAKPHKEMDLADHVLSKFNKDEQNLLVDLTPSYLEQLQLILKEGAEPAMKIINQRTAQSHERND